MKLASSKSWNDNLASNSKESSGGNSRQLFLIIVGIIYDGPRAIPFILNSIRCGIFVGPNIGLRMQPEYQHLAKQKPRKV